MPQIATAVFAGAAILLCYRFVQKQLGRQAATARANAPSRTHRMQDLGALVWDEQARVYRPR